jgi:hypothetical protein
VNAISTSTNGKANSTITNVNLSDVNKENIPNALNNNNALTNTNTSIRFQKTNSPTKQIDSSTAITNTNQQTGPTSLLTNNTNTSNETNNPSNKTAGASSTSQIQNKNDKNEPTTISNQIENDDSNSTKMLANNSLISSTISSNSSNKNTTIEPIETNKNELTNSLIATSSNNTSSIANNTAMTSSYTSGSGIPTPIQTNTNRFTMATSLTSKQQQANSQSQQTSTNGVHQRGATTIGASLTANGNQIKLKKSDTGRGNADFPKSASTDKSRIESFLSRNVPQSNTNTTATTAASNQPDSDGIRMSHSYRSKAEMLQQQQQQPSLLPVYNQHTNGQLNGTTNATATKSLSAAPIKPADAANGQSSATATGSNGTKSELRPRLVISAFISILCHIYLRMPQTFIQINFQPHYSPKKKIKFYFEILINTINC